MDDTRTEFGCTFGADGRVQERSELLAAILGSHSVVFDAVVASDRERLLRALTERDSLGTPFDLRWKDPTGRVRALSCQLVSAADSGQEPPLFDMRVREVTELRRLSAVLHAHREVLDQIATSAPIATALDAVARMIEATAPDTTVAVYLRRDDIIELAAAPSAPPAFSSAAAGVIVPAGFPIPGTIEPLAGPLADIASEAGLGFGWWLSVIDENGADVGRVVLLAGEKRFLTADERLQCDEAARLISVAAGTARSVRQAIEADVCDPLTGLLNRAALLRSIEPAASELVALLIDVPALAACNRDLGFAAGDTMLLAVAERLRRIVRSRDLLARWSGSQFVLVGRNRRGDDAIDGFAARIRDAATGRVMVSGQMFDPAPTVTAIFQDPGETPIESLLRLDQAAAESSSLEPGSGGAFSGR